MRYLMFAANLLFRMCQALTQRWITLPAIAVLFAVTLIQQGDYNRLAADWLRVQNQVSATENDLRLARENAERLELELRQHKWRINDTVKPMVHALEKRGKESARLVALAKQLAEDCEKHERVAAAHARELRALLPDQPETELVDGN